MKNRISIVLGPSQLLFLGASIRECNERFDDYLILAGRNVEKERRKITEEIAHKIWPWISIIWASDILSDINSNSMNSDIQLALQLRKRLGVKDVNEIWYCRKYGDAESIALIAYPKAKLVITDEGLGTYLYSHPYSIFRHPSFLKKKLSLSLKRYIAMLTIERSWLVAPWKLTHVSMHYLLLDNKLRRHGRRNRLINDQTFREVISLAMVSPDEKKSDSVPDGSLVLGQYFFHYNPITWAEEFKIYLEVCRLLLNKGPVYWKEHPKNPRPFAEELVKKTPDLKILDNSSKSHYPVELYVDDLNISKCASASSTALFTLNKLSGVCSYTFADKFIPYIIGADCDGAKLVLEHIPVLESETL